MVARTKNSITNALKKHGGNTAIANNDYLQMEKI